MPPETLLLINLLATLAMAARLWCGQLAGAPLLATGTSGQGGVVRIPAVAPLMLVEAVSALLLAAFCPASAPPLLVWLGLMLVVAMWLATFFWQASLVARLARTYDRTTHRRLVRSRWWTTVGWTARGVLMLVLAIC